MDMETVWKVSVTVTLVTQAGTAYRVSRIKYFITVFSLAIWTDKPEQSQIFVRVKIPIDQIQWEIFKFDKIFSFDWSKWVRKFLCRWDVFLLHLHVYFHCLLCIVCQADASYEMPSHFCWAFKGWITYYPNELQFEKMYLEHAVCL